ncbi:MAG: aminoacyl-tRNA hydrolase [Thiovulaceae bacterium]|nr:aminoacyl-tRNA hydrolase [Sulfurimonadaceae bacterium]
MPLFVGLGNPGKAYASTRHNIGFMAVDALLSKLFPTEISKKSFEGELFKADDDYFLKPLTYMNLSGKSVLAVKQFYKIEDVIVIHDDLDLPFGALRFKFGGGHGGHNGLKSIDANIGREYLRVRMGIGKPKYGSVSDYVLGDFTKDEKEHLNEWIETTVESLKALETKSWHDVASQYSQKEIVLKGDDE